MLSDITAVTSATSAEYCVRYTKALDNIKALRKERTADLKVDRERLNFLKSDKDKAERVSLGVYEAACLTGQDAEATARRDSEGEL